jgi:hypothetical protein
VDRRVFREVLSAGYGLLPGRLQVSGGCLGREVFMAVRVGVSEGEEETVWGQCAAVLATLLVIGGMEINPGSVVCIVQVL